MDNWTRKLIHVSGRVQGVGFRFFVKRQAKRYGLVGYVRNLPSGQVEIEAAGNMADLANFLSVVNRGASASRVDQLFQQKIPLGNVPEEFEIRYY